MSPEEIVKAVTVIGALIVGLGAVIGVFAQTRNFVREPFERLEAEHGKDLQALRTEIEKLDKLTRELQMHFDVHGGNLRARVADLDKRLTALDMNGAAERAELAGLIRDLRPILADLKART